MRNGLKDVVQFISENELPEIKKRYPSLKGTKGALLDLAKKEVMKNGAAMFERDTMVMLSKSTQNILVKIMKEDVAHTLSGEVDEPVTADIKRLIRLPGSVHGKSGLRVTPITRQELTDFDPLQMAVPKEYTDDPVKITMRRDAKLDMLGQHFSLSGETEAPEFAAIFLIGRKMADYGYLSEESKKDKMFRIGKIIKK